MQIELIKDFSFELLDAINRLMPQLTSDYIAMGENNLREILTQKNSHLFIARSQYSSIAGIVTLNIFTIPTSKKGYIEDVVVDNNSQGKGVGRQLMEAAIDYARKQNVSKIELTSNPSRVAANKLYQNIGFEKRDTNYYRLQLD